MEAQAELSQWLSHVAELLPFGYAFGAGMVSAVNPCGFAMLPVYLTLYLGAEQEDFHGRSIWYRLAKAFWIALVVTAGFGLLFGVVGAIVAVGGTFLMGIMPWIALVVGLGLVILGVWMLFGKTLVFRPLQNMAARIGDPRQMTVFGFFLFGLAFGATSISCTLPIFLMVVGSSITAGDIGGSLLQFLSYILGMGAIIQVLTFGIAVIKEGVVVGALRKILPYVQNVSALFLILGGSYIVYYWLTSGLLIT